MAAPLPIIRGSTEPLLQRARYTYNASSGTQYTEEWKGASTAKMTTKWNGLVNLVQSADMTFEHDVAELRLVWSGTPSGGGGTTNGLELTIDRWEVPEPVAQQAVFNHPTLYQALYALAGLSSYGSSDYMVTWYVSKLNLGIDNRVKPYELFTEANFPGWTAANSTTKNYIARMYQLVMQGQGNYQYSRTALRHTTNAPNYWSRNVADENVNCIYTTAQLLAECEDPSLWYFPLPGRLDYKISAAAADFSAITPARANYQIGWLKSAGAEATQGSSRTEIQTGYVLDQWSTDVYALATT